jgi:hypothetical protein
MVCIPNVATRKARRNVKQFPSDRVGKYLNFTPRTNPAFLPLVFLLGATLPPSPEVATTIKVSHDLQLNTGLQIQPCNTIRVSTPLQ